MANENFYQLNLCEILHLDRDTIIGIAKLLKSQLLPVEHCNRDGKSIYIEYKHLNFFSPVISINFGMDFMQQKSGLVTLLMVYASYL